MHNKLLTLNDLYSFCKEYCNQQKLQTFSLNDNMNNMDIVVHEMGTFEVEEEENEYEEQGLFPVHLKSCHIDLNRNKSFISREVMEANKNTIHNKPILGCIIQNDDGEYDFDSHNMEVVEDPFNEGETRIHYIEQPIGVVPESCDEKLVYDEKQDKTYLEARGFIYTEYGNGAAEIIKNKNGTKVSVEIAIKDMAYNAKEEYLEIKSFSFLGVTALGEHVGEGMLGSKMTLESFSAKNNSLINNYTQQKLIDTLDKINLTLSNFNIKSKEGGNELNKLQELLEKYNKTESDLDFEYKEMSDEELELKFKEMFEYEEAISEDEEHETETEVEDESVDETESIDDEDNKEETDKEFKNDEEENPEITYSVTKEFSESGDITLSFEISHEDVRNALYKLIAGYEQEDNTYYYIDSVFDNYFIMEDWCSDTIYKQGYIVNGDSVELEGDRTKMFRMLLTEEEKATIEEMQSNYSAYSEYQQELANKDKKELLEKDDYSSIFNEEDFQELYNSMSDFSLEEIEVKADLLLAKYVKTNKSFNFNQEEPEQKTAKQVIGFSTNKKVAKKPYGTLFAEKE